MFCLFVQIRQGEYRKAYFAFTDAILAAQSRPMDKEMCDTVFAGNLWFSLDP